MACVIYVGAAPLYSNLRSYFNTSFFLTLDKAICRQRRVYVLAKHCEPSNLLYNIHHSERKYEGEPDPPKYFDNCIWPSFQHMYDIATSCKSGLLYDVLHKLYSVSLCM